MYNYFYLVWNTLLNICNNNGHLESHKPVEGKVELHEIRLDIVESRVDNLEKKVS